MGAIEMRSEEIYFFAMITGGGALEIMDYIEIEL